MFKTDFLDVTSSLRDDIYELLRIKNCKVVYTHTQLNHHKLIRKSIIPMSSKHTFYKLTLSNIFKYRKKPYNEALTIAAIT